MHAKKPQVPAGTGADLDHVKSRALGISLKKAQNKRPDLPRLKNTLNNLFLQLKNQCWTRVHQNLLGSFKDYSGLPWVIACWRQLIISREATDILGIHYFSGRVPDVTRLDSHEGEFKVFVSETDWFKPTTFSVNQRKAEFLQQPRWICKCPW